MPVQLLTTDNSEDPRVISLQDYEDGRANFDLHYYYTSAQAAFGGQVNDAVWDDLQNAVDSYCTSTSTPPAEVALRFVHCFDNIEHKLFQRVQICKMVPTPPSSGEEVFDLDTTGALWFDIKNGNITSTPNEALEGTEYLDKMYYKNEPQSQEIEKLAFGPDKYVKNLVLPWEQEVLQMYHDNNNPDGAGVHFAACSYTDEASGHANVDWPHGLVIYLSNAEGEPFLNDQDYINLFHNKGADYDTLCPPNCNVYIAPTL